MSHMSGIQNQPALPYACVSLEQCYPVLSLVALAHFGE